MKYMEREEYIVALFNVNDKTEREQKVFVYLDEEKDEFVISSKLENEEIQSQNFSYFSAYQDFRDKMLNFGYGIKCNGSKINAVQSPMMSSTEKVYLVELERQALMKDVVYIWDYADITEFPNTNEQQQFFNAWINSLGNSRV